MAEVQVGRGGVKSGLYAEAAAGFARFFQPLAQIGDADDLRRALLEVVKLFVDGEEVGWEMSCQACVRQYRGLSGSEWSRGLCGHLTIARRISRIKTNDDAIEEVILELLNQRGQGRTICPSEAARALAGSNERAAWEPLMEGVRAAAERLVADEQIAITQRGRIVDPNDAKGPIRLRKR